MLFNFVKLWLLQAKEKFHAAHIQPKKSLPVVNLLIPTISLEFSYRLTPEWFVHVLLDGDGSPGGYIGYAYKEWMEPYKVKFLAKGQKPPYRFNDDM